MAIPSGSGTEVLKNASARGALYSGVTILDGVADHIYTILSVTMCNMNASAADTIEMAIWPSGASGNTTEILRDQSIGAKETFIWNDRLVLVGTDELYIKTATAGDMDVWVSYIDQDWS